MLADTKFVSVNIPVHSISPKKRCPGTRVKAIKALAEILVTSLLWRFHDIIAALSRKAEPWRVFFHLSQAITESSTSEGRYKEEGRGAKERERVEELSKPRQWCGMIVNRAGFIFTDTFNTRMLYWISWNMLVQGIRTKLNCENKKDITGRFNS